MEVPRIPTTAVLVLAGGAVLAIYVWSKGSVANAAAAAAKAAANAIGGAASGTVGAIGATVGLPTPDVLTQDPLVSRWLIDNQGWFVASKWSSVSALSAAMQLDAWTGTPPPRGSAIAIAFPGAGKQWTTGDFTRTDHDYDLGDGAPSLPGFTANDPANWGVPSP